MSPAGAKLLAVAQGGQPGLHPDYVGLKAHVCGKARDLGKDGGCKGQLAVVIKDLRNTRTLVEDQAESDTPPPRRFGMEAKLEGAMYEPIHGSTASPALAAVSSEAAGKALALDTSPPLTGREADAEQGGLRVGGASKPVFPAPSPEPEPAPKDAAKAVKDIT